MICEATEANMPDVISVTLSLSFCRQLKGLPNAYASQVVEISALSCCVRTQKRDLLTGETLVSRHIHPVFTAGQR